MPKRDAIKYFLEATKESERERDKEGRMVRGEIGGAHRPSKAKAMVEIDGGYVNHWSSSLPLS